MKFIAVLVAVLVGVSAHAQHKVEPRNMHRRLICQVPIIGSGTLADPKRPLFAPSPSQLDAKTRTGIIAYQFVTSDDGKTALAEFVGMNDSAFQQILASQNVKAFLKGKDKPEDIESEFKKYKKDFKIDQLGVAVQ